MCGKHGKPSSAGSSCGYTVVATGHSQFASVWQGNGVSACTAICLKVARSLLLELGGDLTAFGPTMDRCMQEALQAYEACGFSAGSAVPELLACPAFAELQPLSPIRGRVQDVRQSLSELRLESSRPMAAIITKPPESVLIVLDADPARVFLYDSHPRPQFNMEHSYLAQFSNLSQLAAFLEELFPVSDVGGLQGEMLNQLEAYPFVLRLAEGASESSPSRASADMQSLQCPITRELMADPVLASDGYTYERQSIQQHWENQLQGQVASDSEADCGAAPRHRTRSSPITGEEVDGTLRVNRVVLDLIRSASEEGRIPAGARRDWETRRGEAEKAGRERLQAEVPPEMSMTILPTSSFQATAPPMYARSAEHVRLVCNADPPRWGVAAKVQLANTGLACDFVEGGLWAPNFVFTACMVPGCGAAFGLLRRRHHCRRCGRLVCSTCAPHCATNFEELGQDEAKKARICGECVEDMLDRLERRRLSAGELQQVMVLDARLEQWAAMQCAKHRAAVRAALGPRLEARLARRAGGAGAPRSDSLAPGQVERQRSEERARELGREIERLNQVDASRMDEERQLQHVQQLSLVEAELESLQVELATVLSAESIGLSPGGVGISTSPEPLDAELVAMRQRWEHLLQRDLQSLGNEVGTGNKPQCRLDQKSQNGPFFPGSGLALGKPDQEAIEHFEEIAALRTAMKSAETGAFTRSRAAAASNGLSQDPASNGLSQESPPAPAALDMGSFVSRGAALQRSDWPLPMDLEVPAPWPTARMRKREEMIYRERRREVLLVREQFEVRMEHLARAREMELARERERELLRQQEEQQRRQEEALAEERRQRARELDEMARAAVHRMVGQGTARMCRRCRAGPIMNDHCGNLATHNRDPGRRRNANHCPRCGWFDKLWQNWPEWDGIYGAH
ncbi:unnamed protein product [Effrenium voratum]|nr:unnamed protein product [Effrenium voratum]